VIQKSVEELKELEKDTILDWCNQFILSPSICRK
jgi:hypothetical protein